MTETFGITKQIIVGGEQRTLTAVDLGCPPELWKRVMELRGIRNVKGQVAADKRAVEMRFGGAPAALNYTPAPVTEEPVTQDGQSRRKALLNSILSN